MTFRDHILTGLAAQAPHCMNPACRRPNRGDIVASHSNLQADGKGMSLKASDAAIAFLCSFPCHHEVDQGKRPQAERLDIWEAAHRATMIWLIETGRLVAFADPQPPRPEPVRPKRAMKKGRKMASRPFQKSDTPQKIPSRPFPSRKMERPKS